MTVFPSLPCLSDGDNAALVDVHYVPGVLEVADVCVGQEGVLFIGVEQ